MTIIQPIVCTYCGNTIPPSTVYYTLRKLGDGVTTFTYCHTDYSIHQPDDLASGLQSFGAVTIQELLTDESA